MPKRRNGYRHLTLVRLHLRDLSFRKSRDERLDDVTLVTSPQRLDGILSTAAVPIPLSQIRRKFEEKRDLRHIRIVTV